eukprot:scaffold4498_cov119-Isochrysis_galbana.AAC.50
MSEANHDVRHGWHKVRAAWPPAPDCDEATAPGRPHLPYKNIRNWPRNESGRQPLQRDSLLSVERLDDELPVARREEEGARGAACARIASAGGDAERCAGDGMYSAGGGRRVDNVASLRQLARNALAGGAGAGAYP